MSKKIFYCDKIKTFCPEYPNVQAILVSDGRIEFMGTKDDVLTYIYIGKQQIEEIHLGKGVLYPGFIDTHSHCSIYSNLLDKVYCAPSCGNIPSILRKLKEKADNTPEGEWVIGYSYDDTGIPEARHLNKHDLNAVSTRHPVLVSHISSHMGYANDLALQKFSFDARTKIPGGEVVVDSQGQTTGFLLETAYFKCLSYLPAATPEQQKENLKKAVYEYNKNGFTTIQDGGLGFGTDARLITQSYIQLYKENRLNARMYLQYVPEAFEKLLPYGLWNFGNDYITFGGLKYFTDGSIQGFTGALSQDYHSRPGYKGNLLYPQEEIDTMIEKYHCMNVQIAVHTNGDAASEAVISAFEKALKKNPRTDLRHMLVHAQMVSDSQLERMKACGIIPTFFVKHVEVWGDRHAKIFLGPERMSRLDPCGSAAKIGLPFALHVDTPVLPVTALESMHTAVNRTSSSGIVYGENQRISIKQALEAYTVNAALCCAGEKNRGRLKPGYYADFVLLDKDLEEILSADIKNAQVLKTICGGNIVYEKN